MAQSNAAIGNNWEDRAIHATVLPRLQIGRNFNLFSGCDVPIRSVRDEPIRYLSNVLNGIFLAAMLSLSANAGSRPSAATSSSVTREATQITQTVRVDHPPSLNGTLDKKRLDLLDQIDNLAKPT